MRWLLGPAVFSTAQVEVGNPLLFGPYLGFQFGHSFLPGQLGELLFQASNIVLTHVLQLTISIAWAIVVVNGRRSIILFCIAHFSDTI